jgi:hypothetical protein
MAAALGYLLRRPNGRYSVRFQKPNGRWSLESLGTRKAAEAKLRFELWKQEQLKRKFAGLQGVTPVRLSQLAQEHLANVRRHQAASWPIKQRRYLYRSERDRQDSPKKIIEWFGPARLTTEISPNDIRAYIDHLRDIGLKSITCDKVLSCMKAMFRFAEERGYWPRTVILRGARSF